MKRTQLVLSLFAGDFEAADCAVGLSRFRANEVIKAVKALLDERLKGKKTLWPFGFHCTGMPIQAAADNLRMHPLV